MADALQKLAPPLAPPMPMQAAQAQPFNAAMLAAAALLLLLIIAWLVWKHGMPLWRRWRLRKELNSLPEGADISGMAQQLVELIRKHRLQAADAWWEDADALRFRRPMQGEGGQRMLAELKHQILAMERMRD